MPEHSSHITKKMLTMSTEMPADGFTLVLLLKVYLKKKSSSHFLQVLFKIFVKSISGKFRKIDFTKKIEKL